MSEPAEKRGGCCAALKPCGGDGGAPYGMAGMPNGAEFAFPGAGCDHPAGGATGAPQRGQFGVFGASGWPQRGQLITRRLFRDVPERGFGASAPRRVRWADDSRLSEGDEPPTSAASIMRMEIAASEVESECITHAQG